jgi:hypothetical protein
MTLALHILPSKLGAKHDTAIPKMAFKILAAVSLLVWTASGQACARSAPSGTVVAPGFTARKIATVVNPRSMTFDKDGHLLVVSAKPMFGGSSANSIEALTLSQSGCVAVSGKSTVLRHNGVRIPSLKSSFLQKE